MSLALTWACMAAARQSSLNVCVTSPVVYLQVCLQRKVVHQLPSNIRERVLPHSQVRHLALCRSVALWHSHVLIPSLSSKSLLLLSRSCPCYPTFVELQSMQHTILCASPSSFLMMSTLQVQFPLALSAPRGVCCVLSNTQRAILYDLEEDEGPEGEDSEEEPQMDED